MSGLNELIEKIDREGGMSNYGYSGNNYGLASAPAVSPTNNTANAALQALTVGCSTVQLTVTVAKASTGSTNTVNPVFLFGGDAYSNTAQGYTAVAVASPVQYTSNAFTNSKNTVVFTYKDPADPTVKYSTYTVSQSTAGEYPFWLNSMQGKKGNMVKAMQLTVADSAHISQLNNAVSTFRLDQYGKSTTNDLTQPKDLYQFNDNGIWYTNPFPITGRDGLKLLVNETNGMVLNLFMYVDPSPIGCEC